MAKRQQFMKSLALSLFLLCSALQNVQAADMAYTSNEAGGVIMLTNEPCIAQGRLFGELMRLYSTTSGGRVIEGCYYVARGSVEAVFENSQRRSYSVKGFSLIKQNARGTI